MLATNANQYWRFAFCLLFFLAALLLGKLSFAQFGASPSFHMRTSATALPTRPSSDQAVPQVANLLNSDGTLKRKGLPSGSFDPSGYQMKLTAMGAPRFVPRAAQTSCSGWDTQFGSANGTNGSVYAVLINGNDVYVGGNFTQAGDVMTTGVARFNMLTNAWSKLDAGSTLTGEVHALALNGNDLYIAGAFGTLNINGTQVFANNIIRFDTLAHTWSVLGTAANNGVRGQVNTVLIQGNNVYLGGQFDRANEGSTPINTNRIARFNLLTNTWAALGSAEGNGLSYEVHSLAASGDELFVGGSFVVANQGGASILANNVARFNTQTNIWSALGTGGGSGVNSPVTGLAVYGNDLYLGGHFTQANVGGTVVPVNRVAKYNLLTNTWGPVGSGGGNGADGSVYTLTISGNHLIIGGYFSQVDVGGTSAAANSVARFNLVTNLWSALGTNSGNGLADTVFAVSANASDIVFGGRFQFVNSGGPAVAAKNVAVFKLPNTGWSGLGLNGNGLNEEVRAFALLGNDLYVGGAFTVAGGVPANFVAKFNLVTNTWSALGSGFGRGVGGSSGPEQGVFALAVSGNDLFVGGNFTRANYGGAEITVNYIAKFNTITNTWSALGTGAGAGVDNEVYALAASGNEVFVGGNFISSNVGGNVVITNGIARYNTLTNTWSTLSADTGVGVNSRVTALALNSDYLFVGGNFGAVNVGGSVVPASQLAKFHRQTSVWSAIGSGSGQGLIGTVSALALKGNDLYISGSFSQVNIGSSPISAANIARFNLTNNTWGVLGNAAGNGTSSNSRALALSGNNVYAGGEFDFVNHGETFISSVKAAKYKPSLNTWYSLNAPGGIGVGGPVKALAYHKGDLYVGGFFSKAGGVSSLYMAKYCNSAPTLMTNAGLTQQAGSVPFRFTLAMADDDEEPPTALGISVNGAPSATINGVTVSSLAVNAVGEITANVSTSCAATSATFALQVMDEGGLVTETPLTITVTPNSPPTLSYPNHSVDIGGALTFTPASGPSDNGEIANLQVLSQGTYTGTLSVNAAGVVSVSNAAPRGNHLITIRVTDQCGLQREATFILSVGCALVSLNPASLPNGQLGLPYLTTNFSAAGGVSPYNFLLTAGALPNGLTFNQGQLSGIPTLTGSFTFIITVLDAEGCGNQRSYTVLIRRGPTPADFDGDGKADLSVFRPSAITPAPNWLLLNSFTGQPLNFAWGGGYAPYFDVPVPGDYDGDGKTDYAIWRGADTFWYVRRSSDGQPVQVFYGANFAPYFDIPTPGDFDGDGKTDIAVYRRNGTWFVRRSSDGGDTIINHGQANDIPLAADFDGDGKCDFGLFRPAATSNNWLIRQSSTDTVVSFTWGGGYAPYFDTPVPADYDGDGKADLAIWRGQDSIWYIRPSATPNSPILELYGANYAPYSDIPVPGDYDGDGKADIAVWRRDGTWYIKRSSNGTNLIQAHGQSGDTPVPAQGVR